MKIKWIQGQSLVETVVAMGIIITTLVALMSAVTYALTNAQSSRNKAIATKYAQEGVEWLRAARDESWNTFVGYAGAAPTGSTYCLDADLTAISSWPNAKTCAANPADNPIDDQYDLFYREATITSTSTGRVSLIVKVYWKDGSRTEDVTVNTYLTQWR